MSNLEFLLVLLATFGICAAVSYAAVRAGRVSARAVPLEGGMLRLKCSHGVYRSRFLGFTNKGWRVAAPLSRDSYVPLRPGEPIVIEAPIEGAALTARTSVLERDADSHELVLARPVRPHRVERRENERLSNVGDLGCNVEQGPATLLDISPFGARLRSPRRLKCGDRVRLDLSWCPDPVFAWVLEAAHPLCRLRFEDRVQLPPKR